MELLVTLFGVVLTLLAALFLNLLSDELYCQLLPFGRWLIRRAAMLLPPQLRSSSEEEWLAHYQEREGNIWKLLHALACFKAALIMRDDFEELSPDPFKSKSWLYRVITNAYFLFDCTVSASLFFLGILLIPLLIFGVLYEIVVRQPFPIDNVHEFFIRKYYDRRDGKGKCGIIECELDHSED